MAAPAEWADRARNLRGQARTLISNVNDLSLHAQANDLTTALADPQVNLNAMPVPDAVQLITLFTDLQAWLMEPVSAEDGAPSRLHVLYKSS